MATVTPLFQRDIQPNDGSVILVSWALTTADFDGARVEWTQWSDRCFQAAGTFGGATVTIEGSNNGTIWFPLSNAAGGATATFTVDGGKQIIELPRFVRPNLTVVGAGATITVTLLARRQQPIKG